MPNKEQKSKVIDSLQAVFAKSKAGVFTDYRGLKTAELVGLRRKLKDAGLSYKVVKNTLARFAAQRSGKDALSSAFTGPMAIAFGSGDEVIPARVVTEHIAAAKLSMKIQGGFLGNKLLTAKEVSILASLPTREVLLGKVMGGIEGPMYAFMGQLNAPLRGFMSILQQKIKQMEVK